jgi:hypothetical protein
LAGKIVTGIFAFNLLGMDDEDVSRVIAQFPGVADFIILPNEFGFFSVETMRVCGFTIEAETKVLEDRPKRPKGRLEVLEERLKGLEGRLEGPKGRLETLEGRPEGVERPLEGRLERWLEGLEGRVGGLEGRPKAPEVPKEPEGPKAPEGQEQSEVKNGYVRYSSKGMGFAVMYGILNSLASMRRFSGSNCIRYLDGELDEMDNRVFQDAELAVKRVKRLVRQGTTEAGKPNRRRIEAYKSCDHILESLRNVQRDQRSGALRGKPE